MAAEREQPVQLEKTQEKLGKQLQDFYEKKKKTTQAREETHSAL